MKLSLKHIIIMVLITCFVMVCSGCNDSSSDNSSNSSPVDSVTSEETLDDAYVNDAADSGSIHSETDESDDSENPTGDAIDEENTGTNTGDSDKDLPDTGDNSPKTDETDTVSDDTDADEPADDQTEETDKTKLSYTIVDTAQSIFYDNNATLMSPPAEGDIFYGQDANYTGSQPSYTDNGDGTVTDNNTGLMWQQDPGDKVTYNEAVSGAASFNLAGYADWRLPTIKELYSLILFSGMDPSGLPGDDTTGLVPFIDTDYFDFEYGNPDTGERIIDSQWATSTEYVNTTMGGNQTMFGVNFADGRIKGYPIGNKTYFVTHVRGNTAYGINDFSENEDGTVTDNSTGLMWMQQDSGFFAAGDDSDGALTWEQALEWAENLDYAGHSDWRVPNAKELQSIVDYTRSPATTGSAAIDPVFATSVIIDESGDDDYPFFWSSTTHTNAHNGANAAYLSFGEALGWMQNRQGNYTLMDVHGAGAQRSDPKIGDPADYPYGHGPQGDVIRIYNYIRCVRDVNDDINPTQPDNIDTAKVSEGYMLLAPLQSKTTYLVDIDESIVHSWNSNYTPGNAAYLLTDGTLLRTGKVSTRTRFSGTGGIGGIIEKLGWNSNVTWNFELATDDACLHHDVEELPNGNILMIAWEYKTAAEAEAAGRNPGLLTDGELWPDKIIEVDPDTSNIVWEWHAWDHLIQDYDETKLNYGTISDHPELIDINYVSNPRGVADWNHTNSVDYNEALDQIIISVHGFDELWIIDHSTTSAEAASHSGGIYGKGGDILYRWGNPEAYDAPGNQEFFGQHDAQWIPDGTPGAGNILVFNNGQGRPEGNYSTVEEIIPAIDSDGFYPETVGQAFGPSFPEWIYTAPTPTNFYGQNISGAQRLPNGNTLICEGPDGYIFEVTDDGSIVWSYQNTDGKSVFRVHKYSYDYSGLFQL